VKCYYLNDNLKIIYLSIIVLWNNNGREKVTNSYKNDCILFTINHFNKLWQMM